MTRQEKKAAAFRQGVIVLIVLAVLTAGEFFVARSLNGPVAILFIFAIFKAAPIMQYFMHMSSLWSEEEGH